jgi:hypothetical protein
MKRGATVVITLAASARLIINVGLGERRQEMQRRFSVGIDFDGVLHQYDGDWQGHDVIPGGPVDGAIEWLTKIAQHFDVWINSTRCATEAGCQAIREWLRHYELPVDTEDAITISPDKKPCLIYVDDRGWRFDGKNFPSPEQIHAARPWWRS